MSQNNTHQKYQDMLKEVEDIVRTVASPDLDLDQMVNKVERGYELIQKMQDRLSQTRERVEELSKKYEPEI